MFMGANYAKSVFEQWSHLPHHAQLVLIRMALIVKDKDSEPRYWGGWQELAFALGYDMSWFVEVDEKRKVRGRRNAQEGVRRVMQCLVDEGAITRVRGGYAGHNAEYRLNLKAGSRAVEDQP